jgi:hypothetical protein
MGRDRGRRAFFAQRGLPWLALAWAASLAACTTEGRPTIMNAATPGATVAFESIDGPPLGVFNKMVATLTDEVDARQAPVISRTAAPAYRVRAYMAVHVVRKQPHVGWVWDVYDSDQRRMLRIIGEEPGSRVRGDAWAAANEQVLRRIARTGMDRLTAFLDASGSAPGLRPPLQPSDDDGTMVASTRSTPPEPVTAPVPMPPRRPQQRSAAAEMPAGSVVLAVSRR